MGCVIKYKGQSIPEEQFLQYLNKQIAANEIPSNDPELEDISKQQINELFESNPKLANAVYEAVGFNTNNKTIDFSNTEVKEEVYHSSTVEFDEFKQGKDGAIHFGDRKAATERTNKSSKKYLKTVKLKVNNLVESVDSIDFEGTRKDKESIQYIVDKLKIAKTETQEHLVALFANEKITKEQLEQYWNSSLETIYKEIFNADGYSYINLAENKGSKSYVVFNPNQIEVLEDGEIKYNEDTKEYEYINSTNQLTPQQKQQALQLYSKYLESLNNPDTNPILQNNQKEQVKKFAELQERLNNKEFLEGAKSAYESTPELQQFGTQEEYNDYIARVSLGIIKNPSSGEYNYTSQVKDIVFRGKTGNQTNQKSKELGIFFTDDKNAANIYAVKYKGDEFDDSIIQGIVNKYGLNPTIEQIKSEIAFFEKMGATKEQIEKDAKEFQKYILNNKGITEQAILNIKNPKNLTVKDWFDNYENSSKLKENSDGLLLKGGKQSDNRVYDAGENQLVVFEPEQIHLLGSKQDVEGFKEFVQGKSFDKELAQKIQDKLQKLYPEIKLNITNNPVWEQGDNVFNQEEYNNQVNYRLKATEKVLDNLNKIKQWESNKSIDQNTLWKKIGELGISKQQLDLLKESEGSTIEEKLSSFAANYSYTIEINTAKENKVNQIGNINKEEWDKRVQELANQGLSIEERRDILEKEFNTSSIPTQHYSNLTVPGGTNYTENEIKTPDITPNIKGHAQFSTDNGIGWFRSDDRDNSGLTKISSESKLESNYEYTWSAEQFSYNGSIYKEVTEAEPGLGSYDAYYKDNKQITKKEYQEAFDNKPKKDNSKTRRILEVQSDLFQKGRDKEDLVTKEDYNAIQGSNQGYGLFSLRNINYAKTRSGFFKNGIKISEEEYNKALEEHNKPSTYGEKHIKENQFLQLLNKDNNWVTFFIKSIIQDSAKKGYEKVLFPTGETAAKVEGHETIVDEIRKIDNSIKDNNGLLLNIDKGVDIITNEDYYYTGRFRAKTKDLLIEKINNENKRLEQEKADFKSQGIEKLKPIEGFYEIKVGNILEKQFGKDNVKTITDEYGNQWREITIDQARDLQNILLQKDEANRIIGQANIKAMTVLVDAINQKQDTLPHEYAHHYIAWFRNTPIVQEAIKKWGSEEALVQSIGEQVVKQKGEAYNWWNRFVKWIMNQFNSLSKLQKEELTQILTDAFLTRQDLNNIGNNSFQQFQQSYNEEKSLKLALKGLTPEEKISFCNHFGITMTEENGKKC